MSKLKKLAIVLLSIPGAILLFGGLAIRVFVSSYDSTLIQAIRSYSDILQGDASGDVGILLAILKIDEYAPWIVAGGIVWLIIAAYVWDRSVRK